MVSIDRFDCIYIYIVVYFRVSIYINIYTFYRIFQGIYTLCCIFQGTYTLYCIYQGIYYCIFQGIYTPYLQLYNLKEGIYIFMLKVEDAIGQQSIDTVKVTVKSGITLLN